MQRPFSSQEVAGIGTLPLWSGSSAHYATIAKLWPVFLSHYLDGATSGQGRFCIGDRCQVLIHLKHQRSDRGRAGLSLASQLLPSFNLERGAQPQGAHGPSPGRLPSFPESLGRGPHFHRSEAGRPLAPSPKLLHPGRSPPKAQLKRSPIVLPGSRCPLPWAQLLSELEASSGGRWALGEGAIRPMAELG